MVCDVKKLTKVNKFNCWSKVHISQQAAVMAWQSCQKLPTHVKWVGTDMETVELLIQQVLYASPETNRTKWSRNDGAYRRRVQRGRHVFLWSRRRSWPSVLHTRWRDRRRTPSPPCSAVPCASPDSLQRSRRFRFRSRTGIDYLLIIVYRTNGQRSSRSEFGFNDPRKLTVSRAQAPQETPTKKISNYKKLAERKECESL